MASPLTQKHSFNPVSILPDNWSDPSDASTLRKALKKSRKRGIQELFSWHFDSRIKDCWADFFRIRDQLHAQRLDFDSLLWMAALIVAERWDSQGFDWTEANTFCWSLPLSSEFAVTLTGWLNRTMKHGVPVLEMQLMGLNACAMTQRVPTQVPPRSPTHPDFRSFDGIHQRCEWALDQIQNGFGEWPYANYAITEGELGVVLRAEEIDEPPAIALGDQILASAKAAGHDFDQGDYAFDERMVWGGKTYRVQGLANHAPGFAPMTQMAVKSVQRINE